MYERLVKDVMSRELITCAVSTPIVQVMRRLIDHSIHAIVVVDEAGYAIGIVSQTDVLQVQYQLAGPEGGCITAGDIMSTHVITCSVDTPLLEAVTLMTRNHIHRLVVAKGNNEKIYPLGILSMTDVIRYVIKDTAIPPTPRCLQAA
ncbi:hypothetical protein SE17_38845 [Kouleothrix aurantiaca]|uniref:CBS domain-containing protein n=1 Tax=Kouleothrix aurantiaca TaxID=186479 RepID=A0A0P9CQN7_9CHLR|nr:hypothetical protein SE17_38845 [Kouleothrix aurantiaca]